MGIHITLYKIVGVEEFTDYYPTQTYRYFKKEKPDWWDSLRCAGDTEFNNNIDFDYRSEGDDPNNKDDFYKRPKNKSQAIDWVQKNTPASNRERLLKMLDEMLQDENLWLRISY